MEQSALENQVQHKNSEISGLEKTIQDLKNRVTQLEKAKPKNKTTNDSNVHTDNPQELYKKARNLLLEEEYTNAATLFKRFIKDHPDNSLADNAAYWLAECYYSMGDYKTAVLLFKDLEIQYPKSEKVPDALLKAGYSYLALDDSNRAHHYLKKVLKKYPFSPAAEKAQEKLGRFE